METKTQTTSSLIQELEAKRERLKKNTETFKEAIESQINNLKDNALKYSVRGLIFAGVAVVSYATYRFFSTKAETETKPNLPKEKTDYSSGIVAMIVNSITMFLLSIAKEQLLNYIEKHMFTATNERATNSQRPSTEED